VVGASGWQFNVGNARQLAARINDFFELSVEQRAELGRAGYTRVNETYTHAKFRERLAQLPGLSDLLSERH
jgi:hypothetical protein